MFTNSPVQTGFGFEKKQNNICYCVHEVHITNHRTSLQIYTQKPENQVRNFTEALGSVALALVLDLGSTKGYYYLLSF